MTTSYCSALCSRVSNASLHGVRPRISGRNTTLLYLQRRSLFQRTGVDERDRLQLVRQRRRRRSLGTSTILTPIIIASDEVRHFSTTSQNNNENSKSNSNSNKQHQPQQQTPTDKVSMTIARLQQQHNPYDDAIARLPHGAQLHLDFFGEPVTFLGADRPSVVNKREQEDTLSSAIASLDGFLVGVASKGKAFTGGGEEDGVSVQAAHSAALAWADLLRFAALWNQETLTTTTTSETMKDAGTTRQAPMLVHVALAPLLAQTGVAYLHHLDHLLRQVDSGIETADDKLKHNSIWDLVHRAAAMHENEDLHPRKDLICKRWIVCCVMITSGPCWFCNGIFSFVLVIH